VAEPTKICAWPDLAGFWPDREGVSRKWLMEAVGGGRAGTLPNEQPESFENFTSEKFHLHDGCRRVFFPQAIKERPGVQATVYRAAGR